MSDRFEQSEFTNNDAELSPSEHFESTHSPSLSYTHIEKSLASIEAGLDKFDDEKRTEAETYANVTVFREVMQYIEEFGIYFYNRLNPDEDFIEAITGTRPRQIKEIFEKIRDGELDQVIREYQGDAPDKWLKHELGYDKIENRSDEISLDDIIADQGKLNPEVNTIDQAIAISLETVRAQLQEIAGFFLRFEEPYNAIKHGNRVSTLAGNRFTVGSQELEVEAEVDEQFVSFLCKTSGSRRGGELYTFTVPVRMLREQAVAVVKLTRNIYSQIYNIRQKIKESQRTGESVNLDPSFYGILEGSGEKNQFRLKSLKNPDATIWLPEDTLPESIDKHGLPFNREIAVGYHEQGGELVIKTEGDQEPSHHYPLLVDAGVQTDSNHLTGMRMTQDFSFRLYELPLWQYLEFLSLEEVAPIQSVTLENVGKGESRTQQVDNSISLPSLPEPEHPDILQYLRNIERAADAQIEMPYYWPPRVLQVIDYYREEHELTRDIARELLTGISELTEDCVGTLPTISIQTPSSTDEQGNYAVVKQDELQPKMGGIILKINEQQATGEFSIVPGDDPRYERGEIGDVDGVTCMFSEKSPEDLYQDFSQMGLEAVSNLCLTSNPEKAGSILEIRRVYGPKFIWYHFDKFHFVIYDEIPPHIETEPEQS